MTARDRVLTIIRILAIMNHHKHARSLFAEMNVLPTKGKIQAHGSAGEGLGKYAAFWGFVMPLFNDPALFSTPFPKDHTPTAVTFKASLSASAKIIHPPAQYASGLLAGLDLMSASKPEGFADSFFNAEKLSEIWLDGLKVYHEFDLNVTKSGDHGSVPDFHFVYPGTKIDYADVDCMRCFSAVKRWDSIALKEFSNLYPDYNCHFKSVIEGGLGGILTSPSSVAPAASVEKQSKSSAKAAVERSLFFADLKCVMMKPADAVAELVTVSAALKSLIDMNDPDDADIIAHLKLKKDKIKADILQQ